MPTTSPALRMGIVSVLPTPRAAEARPDVLHDDSWQGSSDAAGWATADVAVSGQGLAARSAAEASTVSTRPRSACSHVSPMQSGTTSRARSPSRQSQRRTSSSTEAASRLSTAATDSGMGCTVHLPPHLPPWCGRPRGDEPPLGVPPGPARSVRGRTGPRRRAGPSGTGRGPRPSQAGERREERPVRARSTAVATPARATRAPTQATVSGQPPARQPSPTRAPKTDEPT